MMDSRAVQISQKDPKIEEMEMDKPVLPEIEHIKEVLERKETFFRDIRGRLDVVILLNMR